MGVMGEGGKVEERKEWRGKGRRERRGGGRGGERGGEMLWRES